MMHTTPLCNQPIIDIQPTYVVSLVHTNEPVLEIVIDFAVFSCCCLFLFKPLFSYWNCAQCLAVVFIWSTCLVTDCLYRFRWVFRSICTDIVFLRVSRSICSHIFLFCRFSEHLFSYRFVWVFCCRSTCCHIVFSGFSRSICFHIGFFWIFFPRTCSHIVFDWFISEHLFYFLKSVSFLAVFFLLFSEHVFPDYKIVSSSLVFGGARVFILETRIIFTWFFSRTRVPRLQVCIVFAGICRSTCSNSGSLEYLFSYWTCVPFTLGGFPEHLFSYNFFWFFSEHLFSYLKFVSF